MIRELTAESDQARFSENDVVTALYRSLLGRTPDPSGFDAHMKSMRVNGLVHVVGEFVGSAEFRNRYQLAPKPEPLWNYAAAFDPVQTILAHENRAREAFPNHRVNFFGVAVNVGRFFPDLKLDNIVEPPPIPGNWHADVAEFGAALRAVERAGNSFTMAELGCGWGCWMNITAVAARLAGKKPFVIGVEGDEGHLEFAREALSTNGVSPLEYKLFHGIAAAKSGAAFFPKQERAGSMWGLEPVFAVSGDQISSLRKNEKYNELRMVSLLEVIGDHPYLDLLHIDIQGGETDLIRDSIDILNQRVSYIVVGTHSRVIDGEIIDILSRNGGWKLEIERPCFFTIHDGRPQTGMDGVQGWYNPAFTGWTR
jgi:FkbM family methyltransferase